MLRQRNKSLKLISGIDVTAFASVMMVLLFIMMVGQPLMWFHHGFAVDLPKVQKTQSMRAANREDAMIVTIFRDGKLFFGNNLVYPPDQLADQIRGQMPHSGERKIYIRADARTYYRNVSDVIDAIHDAGITDLAFLVDQRRDPAGP